MNSVNKVILVGNLGSDPNTKNFDGGGQVSNITVATSQHWKDKSTGEKKSLTEWSNVLIHGKLSEIAEKYLNKGDKVYIEGYLRTRKWTGSDNVDHYMTEIICRELKMLTPKKAESTPESLTQNNQPPKKGKPNESPSDTDEDDLPF